MATESPFFLTKVECPVCKTINEFETIKVGAYVEEDHDTDFCPKDRRWKNPRYEVYNPLLFFMATCENCYYTREFNVSFKDWKNDTAFRTYRQKLIQSKHLEALAPEDSVLRLLGASRDPNGNPFATAIVKFMLGVYDELMMDHPHKLDIGRFYLRIAWLYREHYGQSARSNPEPILFAKDIEKAFTRLKQSRDSLATNITSVSQLVDSAFSKREGAAMSSSEFLGAQESFKANLAKVTELQMALGNSISSLASVVEQNSMIFSGVPAQADGGTLSFGGFRSFEEYVTAIKSRWNLAPINEQEALLFAIDFYKSALEEGHEIQPGNQQIQATYLIAELSRRVGQNVDAKQYFNNTIKAGQQFIFDNRLDQTRTALARKIVELAVTQGKANLAAIG